MSNESEAKLEKFIEDFKVKFPIVRSQNAMAAYGAKRYPTFAFVGADGQLAAESGTKPSESMIIDALKDVIIAPEAPKSSKLKALVKAFNKQKFADAAQQLKTLSQASLSDEESAYVEEAREFFDKTVANATSKIAKLASGPNFFSSKEKLGRISKQFKGMPTGAEADAELARFKKDKSIQREISAMKKLKALEAKYPLSKRSSAKKIMSAIDGFKKKYRDTFASEQADALRQRAADLLRRR